MIYTEPMDYTSCQNETVPNRMIQIIISHKKRNTTRISYTAQNHQIYSLPRQDFHHILQTYQTAPTHTQIHGQRKLRFVYPCRMKCFYKYAADAAEVYEDQEVEGSKRFVSQSNSKERGVRSGD